MREISKISDVQFAEFKKIADADGNGKIEGEEQSVFEQMQANYKPGDGSIWGGKRFDTVQVGGTQMKIDDVKTIKKDGEHYTVKLQNGVTAEYDTQPTKPTKYVAVDQNGNHIQINENDIAKYSEIHEFSQSAEIFCADKRENGTYTDVRNFADKKVKLTGTGKNDVFFNHNNEDDKKAFEKASKEKN